MENRIFNITGRSKGVVVFGIYFIILAIKGFFIKINPDFHYPVWVPYYKIITSIILLILAIEILQLKEWSRKGVIYFFIFTTLVNLFMLPSAVNSKGFPHPHKEITTTITVILFTLFIIIGSSVVIYFFTRPNVKGQFK